MLLPIEERDIYELTPDPNNSNEHTPEQIEQIADSIEEFGFNDPLSIDATGKVITGHGTREALILLVEVRGKVEYRRVPCVILAHLDERQRRAYVIAHNKIARNSSFNMAKLSDEFNFLVESDFNIDTLGFDSLEMDHLLRFDSGSILPDEPAQPAQAADPEPEEPKRKRAKSKVVHKCPGCGTEFSA